MNNNNIGLQPNELLEYYWNYYQLHAEQRFKILEFFISVEIVLFGGFSATICDYPSISIIIGIIISTVALICFLLDRRTTDLLHHCRLAIRNIEKNYLSNYDDECKLLTNVKNKEGSISYSKLIRSAYGIIAVIGIIMTLVA